MAPSSKVNSLDSFRFKRPKECFICFGTASNNFGGWEIRHLFSE